MAKYKVLGSVAHNLGHSFLSDMNAVATRESPWFSVPQQIYELAKEHTVARLEIDLLAQTIHPQLFATTELKKSVLNYHRTLQALVEDHGSSWDFIRGATLEIVFDLAHQRTEKHHPHRGMPVFDCRVEILDDRNRLHVGRPTNWWIH